MAKIALSGELQDIRGKVGTNVYTKSHTGPVLRVKVKGTVTHTPAQTSVRSAFTRASAAFKNMTPAQVTNWRNYALTITKKNTVNGKAYHPTPINAFNGLTSKFLQINPAGTVPLTPPSSSFTGDTLTITVAGGTGSLAWTANAANAANIKTEFLAQRLVSQNRVPTYKGYRSKGFLAFAAGGLTGTVFVSSGYYAVAYRYVNTLTGQETPLVALGIVQVS